MVLMGPTQIRFTTVTIASSMATRVVLRTRCFLDVLSFLTAIIAMMPTTKMMAIAIK
jgi:hypothetical protein